MFAYVVVHAAAVESLHGAFSGSRIVKFNEAVVEAFRVELKRIRLFCVSEKSGSSEGLYVGQK
jgi:hypothetical protein